MTSFPVAKLKDDNMPWFKNWTPQHREMMQDGMHRLLSQSPQPNLNAFWLANHFHSQQKWLETSFLEPLTLAVNRANQKKDWFWTSTVNRFLCLKKHGSALPFVKETLFLPFLIKSYWFCFLKHQMNCKLLYNRLKYSRKYTNTTFRFTIPKAADCMVAAVLL